MQEYHTLESAYLSQLYSIFTYHDSRKRGLTFVLHQAEIDWLPKYGEPSTQRMTQEYCQAFWEFIEMLEPDKTRLVELSPSADYELEFNNRCMAYGPRIAKQMTHVLSELQARPDTRRANLMILEAGDSEVASAKRGAPNRKLEYPCTVGMNYFLEEDKLHAHVIMRSNNMATVFILDMYIQYKLLELLAAVIGKEPGSIHYYGMDAHILEKDSEYVTKLLGI